MITLLFFAIGSLNADLMDEYYPDRTKGVLEQAQAKGCNAFLCGRIKIKEGKLPEVYEWFNTLNARKDELIEAFQAEGVELETVFLERTNDGDYLIYYTRQEDLEKVYTTLARLGMPIRLFHVECWQRCCEACLVLEPLFDLRRG